MAASVMTSEEVFQKLEQYEELFKHRYTEQDEGYQQTKRKGQRSVIINISNLTLFRFEPTVMLASSTSFTAYLLYCRSHTLKFTQNV